MNYRTEFFDDFRANSLNTDIWFPLQFPHWSNRESAQANYELTPNGLLLYIAEGQLPWAEENDGPCRVSNFQTAITKATLGSTSAQHRFKPGLVVTESQEEDLKALMHLGSIEVRAKLRLKPNNVGALWLVGLESVPEDSGELCVFEVKHRGDLGDAIEVGLGTKNHHDPRFTGEFETFVVAGANDWHIYKMDWKPGLAEFFIDGKKVFQTTEVPTYPQQLMLGIYDSTQHTKAWGEMLIDYVRVTN
jgi:beta-glucanase (GH16 family)